MRSNKMITKEEMPCLFIKFSQHILKGNAWISVWRICMWILGLEGLRNGQTGNRNYATCLATLLQNELTSDVARFTTHIKPVLQ